MKSLHLLILPLLFVCTFVRADTMVLIHGYLGNLGSWETSGVTSVLAHNGWHKAGIFSSSNGVIRFPQKSVKKFYLVDLPSEAPIQIQATRLRPMLRQISQWHPDDNIILVGHSAGGILARLMVVEQIVPNIQALITIATPHVGTPRAIQGLDAANIAFPFSLLQRFFSNDTYHLSRRGQGLFADLLAPLPGNLLFWLNSRAHPDIKYYSVVRRFSMSSRGDNMVPSFSQDMNNVFALRGRSETAVVDLTHTLHPDDGRMILAVLSR